ncbi:integrin alpha-3b isoform X2 [Amia ocellicauda]|uniref:integrin alpha-3b isoform X2 n=1 Tax=Amia ocellicauda TaxID=2972642 RepID=UPI003464230C
MASGQLYGLSKDFYSALVVLLCGIVTCSGFNLDVRFPVVKQGKTTGSFFGFSVALHRQTVGKEQYLLLTGAPKERAVPQLSANETGAVYSCPLTTDMTDCTRMDLVTTVDPQEMVEGMWLGVTVSSQGGPTGGRVLACGHRFVKIVNSGREEQRRMIGRCFVRGNDLQFDSNDDWQNSRYEVCNPNNDMTLEGQCNMGISAGITESDVYIGAPGSYLWQGNVHNTWRNSLESWLSNDKDFGNLNNRYLYIGYSVLEATDVLRKGVYTVLTGAPRDRTVGSVILADMDSKLKSNITLFGEQVGSYFGNSIAATDLNNDGWKDLIVGAPFYFHHKREEGGTVYVFMNENGSFQENATVVLRGPPGSGFGFAVAAIGDINQDGFQDFAVGAPFHGTGKVFIWCGSRQGISQEPSQVIEGQDVSGGGFMTFGYSVTGGMDMDQNSYPDVLVGSLDDKMALLRARPVIHLSKEFSVEPRIVDPSKCTLDSCIKVKVCFSYTLSTGSKENKRNITLEYSLEADRDRRSHRVRFRSGSQDSASVYRGYFSMPEDTCQYVDVILDNNIKDKLQPIVFGLNYSLVEPKPKVRRALQNLDAFPVLSAGQDVFARDEINFQKECGEDNTCKSNLQLVAAFINEQQVRFPSQGGHQILDYNPNVKKLLLEVNVTNLPSVGVQAEDAHQAVLNITIPPTLRYSGVRSGQLEKDKKNILCKDKGTDALICDLGNPFKSNQEEMIWIIFETSGINLYTDRIETTLQLSTISDQKDMFPVPVVLLVEYAVQVSFTVDNEKTTYFSGTVMGESAMKKTSDVGSPVQYTFTVMVTGEPLGSLGTLVVEFDWPYEVSNGKWLLYPTIIKTKGTAESTCVPRGNVINPLNLTLSSNLRRRREVDEMDQTVDPQATSTLKNKKELFKLNCQINTAKCVRFRCPLHNMSTTAEVTVRARVWNSTMLEDYINAARVRVAGRATLKLETDKPTIKMTSQMREFILNIDPALREEKPYEVPMWTIIVAALAGVILLGLIILLLWKCGFFKRASRREMYEAKRLKAEMKTQPSETERLTEDY